MRLVSEKPIATGRKFKLFIELPLESGERQRIPLEASSRWSSTLKDSGFSEAGFVIVGPPEAQRGIENLIAGLKRRAAELYEGEAAAQVRLALRHYQVALEVFMKLPKHNVLNPHISPYESQILDLLLSRDGVQEALNSYTLNSSADFIRIVDLDQRLKKDGKRIAWAIDLADWRASLNRSIEAWWWYLDDRLGVVGSFASLVCLTAALSLLLNISSRFLSGGLDLPGASAIMGQSVLTLLAAKASLTRAGQKRIERFLEWTQIIRKSHWHKVKFAITLKFAIALLVLFCAFGLYKIGLPWIADHYRDSGYKNFCGGYDVRLMSVNTTDELVDKGHCS